MDVRILYIVGKTLCLPYKLNVAHVCTGLAFELAYKSLIIADFKPIEKTHKIEKLHGMLKEETQGIVERYITGAGWKDSAFLLKYLDERMTHPDRKYWMENPWKKAGAGTGFVIAEEIWNDILNRPTLSYEARIARHDMFFSPEFGLHFRRTNNSFQLVGNLSEAKRQRETLLEKNPNMIFLLELRMRDADPNSPFYKDTYDDDFPWIRDTIGNTVSGGGEEYTSSLIDFTHPDVQEIIIQQAIAVARCGLYDGIFLDWWREDWHVLEGYRAYEEEQRARDTIIQRIRAGVGDNFLILVNPNRSKPMRAAPYINGLFMETVRDHDGGYTYNGLREIEDTLFWAEENLRSPQINCLEGWGVEAESPDSPTNLRWMRVFTVMGLTHSDGYVLYITGIRHPIHEHDWSVFEITRKEVHDQDIEHNHHHDHYWYDFWEADLGQPIGAKAQLYENRKGLFIRDFTKGWVVYNRSGKKQNIQLPETTTGISSSTIGTEHIIPDLDGEIYLKQATNPADINGDGIVNILDLVAIANAIGKTEPDLNGDGTVNILDLVIVANAF